MMGKNKSSVKMSENNFLFWKKLNINLIKSDYITEPLSYSELQEGIVKYFKLNNDRYLELIDLMGKQKNGA